MPSKKKRRVGRLRLLKTPGLPYTMQVRLVWTWYFADTLDVGNTYHVQNVFRGNSPYDPDQTGVGNQPYGYDEMAALYDYYHVDSSTIDARITTTVATTTVPRIGMLVVPRIDATATYNFEALQQCPYYKRALVSTLEPGHITSVCTNTKMYPCYLPKSPSFTSAIGTNPGAQWYWHVLADAGEWSHDAEVSIWVKITYLLTFINPTQLGPS
jgi:hypothetical protein